MKSSSFVSELCLALLSSGKNDNKINSLLEKLCVEFNIKHVLILFMDSDFHYEYNTGEIAWDFERFKKYIKKNMDLISEEVKEKKVICSNNSENINKNILSYFEKRKLPSYILAPVFQNKHISGFVLFEDEDRSWSEDEKELIGGFAGVFAVYNSFDLKRNNCNKSFYKLFDHLNDPLIVIDKNGRSLYANNSFYLIFGYNPEDLKNLSIMEMKAGKKLSNTKQIFGSFLNEEKNHVPLEMLKKDGNGVLVETSLWAGIWEDKECFFVLMKDLSKENEALLKFTKLFDANPALMAIVSLPELVYIDANQAFLNKLGYTGDEVLGKTGYELNVFNEKVRRKALKSIAEKSRIIEETIEFRCKNGEILEGICSIETIETQGQKYALMVIVDVTDIHKKEQELEQFFMVNLDLLSIADLNGHFLKVNKEWEYTLGYNVEELNNREYINLVHPDDVQKTIDAANKLEKNEKLINFVNRYKKRMGHTGILNGGLRDSVSILMLLQGTLLKGSIMKQNLK